MGLRNTTAERGSLAKALHWLISTLVHSGLKNNVLRRTTHGVT